MEKDRHNRAAYFYLLLLFEIIEHLVKLVKEEENDQLPSSPLHQDTKEEDDDRPWVYYYKMEVVSRCNENKYI